MKIIKVDTHKTLSQVCAFMFEEQINKKPNSKICFATGSSPVQTYIELIKKYNQGLLDFSQITTFNLDEYVGIPTTNKCSYHYFMDGNLFNHINVKRENINFPNGNGNVVEEAKKYEEIIKKHGGIDFTILGIGTNGHIAFNEPGSTISDRTREVQLTQSTIESNKIYFDKPSDMPLTAISMGIGTILESKKIVLIASGTSKANAIRDMVLGPVSPECPASFLQLHNDVTVIVDEEAGKYI